MINYPSLTPIQTPQPVQTEVSGGGIPAGAQVGSDTVSVEAARTSNANKASEENTDEEDTVTIEASGRSFSLPKSNDVSETKSTTEGKTTSTSTEGKSEATSTSSTSSTTEKDIETTTSQNILMKKLQDTSNPLISRQFFGNPVLLSQFKTQK